MAAAQVIDQLKALPPEERAKVVEFVHEMEATRPERVMDQSTFDVPLARLRPAR
jgi:mRNA-degrading endonuclease RelE of RelBE toxin-antitoxin system